jgi:hypothetical protein
VGCALVGKAFVSERGMALSQRLACSSPEVHSRMSLTRALVLFQALGVVYGSK